MGRRIVVVGGGAAGGTAAQFARKTDRNAEITVFEAGKYPQYSKCALPYLISKKVKNVVEFSEEWFKHANINLLLGTMVKEVDVKSRRVLAEHDGETIETGYDSLILATGANSAIPPIPGVVNESGGLTKGVFLLRTLDDAYAISSFIPRVQHAVIVGAGAIGLEMAEALYSHGVKVTVVEMLPSILPGMLDSDTAGVLQKAIPEDILILTGHRVLGVEKEGDVVKKVSVENEEGEQKTLEADMVLIATGIKANSEVAKKIGCKIGEYGGVSIDGRCRTSLEGVYAVGDCTEYLDFVTQKPFLVGLGSIAVRQGIVAGVNAAGGRMFLPEGFVQTRTTKLFGVEVAAVGPTLKQIQNINPVTGRFTGGTLPDYFPGGEEVTVKVAVNPADGVVVAAQAVGVDAAQRINVFACAIMNKMSVEALSQMETAYAPPVAPTLDPLTIACDVARMRYVRKR
ncbi:MAG: NAD(FAD)-dependent dehydrogenase [Thermoplasmata archaeon]|nr:MAG: NAD(FAD)-dependent dehydrogenase [Thermoplasmata archaeon]